MPVALSTGKTVQFPKHTTHYQQFLSISSRYEITYLDCSLYNHIFLCIHNTMEDKPVLTKIFAHHSKLDALLSNNYCALLFSQQ